MTADRKRHGERSDMAAKTSTATDGTENEPDKRNEEQTAGRDAGRQASRIARDGGRDNERADVMTDEMTNEAELMSQASNRPGKLDDEMTTGRKGGAYIEKPSKQHEMTKWGTGGGANRRGRHENEPPRYRNRETSPDIETIKTLQSKKTGDRGN